MRVYLVGLARGGLLAKVADPDFQIYRPQNRVTSYYLRDPSQCAWSKDCLLLSLAKVRTRLVPAVARNSATMSLPVRRLPQ